MGGVASLAAVVPADEPTAQLDSANGRAVMALLRDLVDGGLTALVATHDPVVVEVADVVVELADGAVAGRRQSTLARVPR